MRDVIFMGRVLASVTHEMQNIMAIIKESGALAEDIMALNSAAELKHGDKLGPALANIREQVERSRALLLRLNGFAHAAEDFAEECDLARCAGQITVLAARAATLRECALRLDLDPEPQKVRANAFMVMQSLYLAIGEALERCPKGSSVTVSSRKNALRISCADAPARIEAGAQLAKLMAEMGGRVENDPDAIGLSYPE